jgi:hypothetical protein
MRRVKKILNSVLPITLVLIGICATVIFENTQKIAVPHEEAERIMELLDMGYTDEEVEEIIREEFSEYYYTPEEEAIILNGGYVPEDGNESVSQPTQSATEQPKKTAPAKVWSHDFDAITDEAKESFAHFSKDGVEDSMYLNIAMESAMNTIEGSRLNATHAGNETGIINYVDGDGNILFSWIFEDWRSDMEYALDLSAFLEPCDSEDLKAAYKLKLQDITLPTEYEDVVKLKIASPYADGTEVMLFTESAGEYLSKNETLTVEDGFITITFTEAIESLILSPENILKLIEEEPIAESVEEASTPVIEEPVEEAQETVEEPVTEEAAVVAEKPNYTLYIIIGICAVAVFTVGAVAVAKKKPIK